MLKGKHSSKEIIVSDKKELIKFFCIGAISIIPIFLFLLFISLTL